MLRTLIALLFSIYSFGAIAQYDYDTDTVEYIEEAVTDEEEYDEESFSDEDTEQQYIFTTLLEQDTFTPAARMVSASTKDKFRNDSDFWYVEKGREKKEEQQEKTSVIYEFFRAMEKLFNEPIMKVILWIAALFIFMLLIFWIAGLDFSLLVGKGEIAGQNDAEESTDVALMKTDMQAALQLALRENDLRLAVRLMFLISLKNLSDRKILHYNEHTTNAEYVRELWGSEHYHHFFQLARAFEYVWYGNFEITAENFTRIEQHFQPFKTTTT